MAGFQGERDEGARGEWPDAFCVVKTRRLQGCEKKRRVKGAARESEKLGLREVRKVEQAEEVSKEWYGVYCVEKTNEE